MTPRWRRLIHSAVAGLESRRREPEPAPAGAVDRALALLGLALLAIPLSGAVAAVTRRPLPEAVGLGLALCAGWAVLTWPYLGRRKIDWPLWLVALAGFAAVAGFAWWQLWNPYFEGFPALKGGDGGRLLVMQRLFGAGQYRVYRGMVALFATTRCLEAWLGADGFESFRAAFYLVVAVQVGFVMWATAMIAGADGPARTRALPAFALVALAGYYPLTRVILPLLHYYQADGFWAQLFGMIPLYVTAGLYAAARHRLFRLLAPAFGIFFIRYTYLLNLGDLLLAAVVLAAWETATLGGRPWARLGLGIVTALGLPAAGYCYVALAGRAHMVGGVVHDDPKLASLATLLLAGLLLAAPLWFRAAGLALPRIGGRLCAFAGVFGLVSALASFAYVLGDGDETYYWVKYPTAGLLLTISAAVVLIGFALSQALTGARPRGWRRGLALAAALGLAVAGGQVAAGSAGVYRTSFAERSSGTPPWNHLTVLADPEVRREIARVLGGDHQFGGLWTWHLPERNFIDALFGLRLKSQAPPRFVDIVDEPGACVFWYAGGPVPPQLSGNRAAPASCREYLPVSAPGQTAGICHVCWP